MTDPTSLPEETLDPTTPEEWEALGHEVTHESPPCHGGSKA